MQFSRDFFLSTELTTYHGLILVAVSANIASLAHEQSTQWRRDSMSMSLSFQRLIGWRIRSWKRTSCSSSFTDRSFADDVSPKSLGISSSRQFPIRRDHEAAVQRLA